MQADFNSSFDEYLLSRIQDATDQHKADSASYHKMKKLHKELYLSAEQVIESLPESDKEVFAMFFDCDFTLHADEDEIIYHQGMKDCVSILQALGVL